MTGTGKTGGGCRGKRQRDDIGGVDSALLWDQLIGLLVHFSMFFDVLCTLST